jgi:hypothetical protein
VWYWTVSNAHLRLENEEPRIPLLRIIAYVSPETKESEPKSKRQRTQAAAPQQTETFQEQVDDDDF